MQINCKHGANINDMQMSTKFSKNIFLLLYKMIVSFATSITKHMQATETIEK